jgi:glycosyltransferase involved in cell wall biosynthesis
MKMGNAHVPLISIIVTVYNLEDYVGECLDSLVGQREADFEVVVVDNGSTDQSVSICRSYAKLHPQRIRLVELPAPGRLYRAHQAGLCAASGIYIQFVDGDDWLERDYLFRAAEILRAQVPDVLVGRFTSFTQKNGLPFRDAVLDGNVLNGQTPEEVIAYLRTVTAFHLAYWRYLFRRSIVGEDFFRSSLPENQSLPLLDALITYRILYAAHSFALLESPFYHYRSRDDSTSNTARRNVLWHAQGWVEFLLYLRQGSYHDNKRFFVLDKLYQELKLMLGSSDTWDETSWSAVASQLSRIGDCGDLLEENALALLRSFGRYLGSGPVNAAGLKDWFHSIRQSILDRVRRLQPAAIYVFPAGRYARDVHNRLKNEGYANVRFLDNNPEMAGRIIQGDRCLLPAELDALRADEKAKSLVLIATIYPGLEAELLNQCRSMGLTAGQIFIV